MISPGNEVSAVKNMFSSTRKYKNIIRHSAQFVKIKACTYEKCLFPLLVMHPPEKGLSRLHRKIYIMFSHSPFAPKYKKKNFNVLYNLTHKIDEINGEFQYYIRQ